MKRLVSLLLASVVACAPGAGLAGTGLDTGLTHSSVSALQLMSNASMAGSGSDASGSGALRLPAKKACLAEPTMDGSSDIPEYAASAGLSYTQTKQAMNAFLPKIQRCIQGEWPEGTVELSITVGCNGRVDSVQVGQVDGLSDELTSCIADTLRYAPFPAHDLPDGETFTYPMTFSR